MGGWGANSVAGLDRASNLSVYTLVKCAAAANFSFLWSFFKRGSDGMGIWGLVDIEN